MSGAMPLLATMKPGDPLPSAHHRIDQRLVDRYAVVSDDLNPLHTDPEFAATTFYGRTIAHGMMTLALISDAMRRWAGPAWIASGTLDVTFLSPAFPGDDLSVEGEVLRRDGDRLVCKFACSAGERVIAAGEASVILAEGVARG
jgi:3-hydroxybutyryl-CoA dehydratase